MGLYINKKQLPGLYKNLNEIKEPNQAYSKQDFLTELMKQQDKTNTALQNSLSELKSRSLVQEQSQLHQWTQVDRQLQELRKSNLEQKDFETQIVHFLQSLNEKNGDFQRILENEALLKEDIIENVNRLSASIQEISNRLEKQGETNQMLSQRLNEQLELQKDATAKQEDFQEDVLLRLDNQEALTEKIVRQLNHIRSIIFERTNFLASKIEDGYKLTSSYVYKLMTGSDKPLTFFMLNQQKEEKHKNLE
ncbi:hypothetical protein [Neobacillus kokaensis]|uniref:RNA polymerase III Rpc82 C -terminal domain-containing protein n=1 Tax=Neobacillus kokaensis TaxID=2759023 RepID=A0ABQ3N6P9_9BACI|nr:hypothetical protein [Neobacillus kokaensis]GHH96851.1 hypothetical protein AM1BK_03940 [Neobacillus kokaensis]